MGKRGIMPRKVEQAWSSEGNYVIMSRQAGTAPATFQLFHNIIIPFDIHKMMMIVRIRLSFEIEAIRRARLQVIYLTFDNLEILNYPLFLCYKGPTSKILTWRKA